MGKPSLWRAFLCWAFNQCVDGSEMRDLEQRVDRLERNVNRLSVERLYGLSKRR